MSNSAAASDANPTGPRHGCRASDSTAESPAGEVSRRYRAIASDDLRCPTPERDAVETSRRRFSVSWLWPPVAPNAVAVSPSTATSGWGCPARTARGARDLDAARSRRRAPARDRRSTERGSRGAALAASVVKRSTNSSQRSDGTKPAAPAWPPWRRNRSAHASSARRGRATHRYGTTHGSRLPARPRRPPVGHGPPRGARRRARRSRRTTDRGRAWPAHRGALEQRARLGDGRFHEVPPRRVGGLQYLGTLGRLGRILGSSRRAASAASPTRPAALSRGAIANATASRSSASDARNAPAVRRSSAARAASCRARAGRSHGSRRRSGQRRRPYRSSARSASASAARPPAFVQDQVGQLERQPPRPRAGDPGRRRPARCGFTTRARREGRPAPDGGRSRSRPAHADPPRRSRRGARRPAVDCHNQSGAGGSGRVERSERQAVALLEAARHVGQGIDPETAQGDDENRQARSGRPHRSRRRRGLARRRPALGRSAPVRPPRLAAVPWRPASGAANQASSSADRPRHVRRECPRRG